VLINGWSPELPVPVTPAEKAKITFVIADVTLGRGYTSFARIVRKQEKYKHLVTQLRQAGFNVTAFTRGFCSLDAKDDIIAGQPIRLRNNEAPPQEEAPSATDVGVLSFGVTGEIYRSTKTCLSALGIQGAEATSLLEKIHYAIINDTCSILSTRQRMDYITVGAPGQQSNGQTANGQQANLATTGRQTLSQPDRPIRRRTGNVTNSQPDRKKRRLSGIG